MFEIVPMTVFPIPVVKTLVKVAAECINPVGITVVFPITIWTARASPNARAIPNTIAVKIPLLALGIITREIVCQRVAPSPADALRYCLGTALKLSIVIEVIVGKIIKNNTQVAARIPKPVPPKKRRKKGTITVKPTYPYTTDGIPTNNSMVG